MSATLERHKVPPPYVARDGRRWSAGTNEEVDQEGYGTGDYSGPGLGGAVHSRYGCGADDCTACYPFRYRCEWCGEDFPEPVPNGDREPKCEACGYDPAEWTEGI